MGKCGISPNASDKEKIKSEWADELNGQNSTGNIAYVTYSELFDVGMDLLDRMYEMGKYDGEEKKNFMFCPKCGARMEDYDGNTNR